MIIKNLFYRAAAATAIAATVLAPTLASAATYVQNTQLTVGGQTLTIAAGSQYQSITVGATSFTVTLAAGQAFIVRSPGTSPRSLENDANQPACHVLTTRDNQLTLNGPIVATVTPSSAGCSTTNYSNDRTPFVTLISPNGGQTVKAGDNVQVFWSNSGTAAPSVRLALSTDGGQTWPTTLADGLFNNGFYSWAVPSMSTSTQARLRVDGIDQGRIVAFDLSDADFVIEGTMPAPTPAPPSRPPYDPAVETAQAVNIDVNQNFPQASGTANCVSGVRIKALSSSAVYYCGRDGKRHAFPNQKIHDTWYQGFAGVQVLTDLQLASVPLGANVTYRPGVRMVKVQTDPKVYAVASNGTLRWVQDEWSAIRLYGADWNTEIDDLSDALFVDYTVGHPVPAN